MKKIVCAFLAVILALITVTVVTPVQTAMAQTTIYVDTDATGANDGTSWADAYTNLQSALSAATSGDEIRVAQGTYYPGTSRPDYFAMKNGVAIYGGYAGDGEPDPDARSVSAYPTILSGDIGTTGNATDNCYHVFYHPDGTNLDSTAVLDGFTITGGNANGSGDHSYGGGMFNDYSSPAVTNCTFNNNSADDGGGMFNDYSSPAVTNCTFSSNSVDYGGGGMCNYRSSPTVTNCTFSSNLAGGGGGMLNHDCSPAVTNCTFSGNTAGEYGGGMYNDFYCEPRVTNCVLWGDAPGEIYNNYISIPEVTYCDIQGGYDGVGNIDADPLLDGSLHLQAGSPCIDAGNNAAVPSGVTTDFEGDPRFLDDTGTPDTGSGTPPIVDMGADEYEMEGTCGDVNDDGNVNMADVMILWYDIADYPSAGAWTISSEWAADVNCDEVINMADVMILWYDIADYPSAGAWEINCCE